MTTKAEREERRALEAKRVAALVRALRADAKKKDAAKAARKAAPRRAKKKPAPPRAKISPAAKRERARAKEAEKAYVQKLVRDVKKSVREARESKAWLKKQRARAGLTPPRVQGKFAPKPVAPPPPRRLKKKPPVLRGPRGEFAPKDTVGETEPHKGFVQVFLPGWQTESGAMGVSYSSLRTHRNRKRYLRRMQNAGDWRSREFRLLAEEIARDTRVHVREVYTLGLSP